MLRAKQAQERTERRAKQAQERAERQIEEVEDRAKHAEELNLLKSGSLWATLHELDSRSESTVYSAEELAEISMQIAFFKPMLPPSAARPRIRKNSDPSEKGFPRNQHRNHFKTDLWGNLVDETVEVCHLSPHGQSCNVHWNPLHAFLTGSSPAARDSLDTQRLEMLKEGYSLDGRNVWYSSLNDCTANHIMMRAQSFMDWRQGFLILPLMASKQMNEWKGEAYDFIFVPNVVSIFEAVKALTDDALAGNHTISSSEQRVSDAFDSFSVALRVFVNVMKPYELTAQESQSAKKHFAEILSYVRKADRFPTPQLPGKELAFRLGSFAAGVCPAPGSRVASTSLEGHPAPCPWLLQARNANAWLTYLWLKRGSGDKRYLGNLGLDAVAVRPAARPRSARTGCVLFPACSDVAGFASCDLCLSRHICSNAWLYQLDPDQTDAVERIRASTQEEGDEEIFDGLRRSLLVDLCDFPDDDEALFEEQFLEEEAVIRIPDETEVCDPEELLGCVPALDEEKDDPFPEFCLVATFFTPHPTLLSPGPRRSARATAAGGLGSIPTRPPPRRHAESPSRFRGRRRTRSLSAAPRAHPSPESLPDRKSRRGSTSKQAAQQALSRVPGPR